MTVEEVNKLQNWWDISTKYSEFKSETTTVYLFVNGCKHFLLLYYIYLGISQTTDVLTVVTKYRSSGSETTIVCLFLSLYINLNSNIIFT